MKSFKVDYKARISDIPQCITRSGTWIIKVDIGNYHKWGDVIQNAIDSFNKTVDWDDMWDYKQAKERFNNGEELYLFFHKRSLNIPLGFVWFRNNYLYNMFMHPSRRNGDTVDFVSSCCNSLNSRFTEITLYCDSWNIKAQKMFEKVGFKKV